MSVPRLVSWPLVMDSLHARTAGIQGGHWHNNAYLSVGLEFNLQPSTSPITALSRNIQTAHHVDHIPRTEQAYLPFGDLLVLPDLT